VIEAGAVRFAGYCDASSAPAERDHDRQPDENVPALETPHATRSYERYRREVRPLRDHESQRTAWHRTALPARNCHPALR
jgi:hypothetical protein